MRALKACLWIMAILCLPAVPAVFLRMSVLESVAGMFGIRAFPDSPMFAYVVRGLAATYVGVSAFYIILALDPARYGSLVPFSGAAAVFVGIVCGIAGPLLKVPVLWYAGDFFCSVVPGVLILVFWRRANTTEAAKGDS